MPEQKRRVPWMKVALVGSLALNLLVLGVIGGARLGRDERAERPNRVVRELGLGPYALGFKREQLKALGPMLRQNRGEMRENRNAMRDGLGTAVALLRATPFDADAFAAHLRAQAERAAGLQEIGQTVLATQIANMTDAERAEFADRMERGISRFGKRKNH